MSIEQVSANKMFGGKQLKFKHKSAVLSCDMVFSVYLPPNAKPGSKVPVIYWLSGLTCTDDNFVQKAGAQQYAADAGVAIVCPDTSPRGEDVPGDPNKAWDFGLGAGFYVNATQAPWSKNYQMYDYITCIAGRIRPAARYGQLLYHGPLDGRPRCTYHRAEKPRQIPCGFRVLANQLTTQLSLG
jgi:S-formylglutathione hydrolase